MTKQKNRLGWAVAIGALMCCLTLFASELGKCATREVVADFPYRGGSYSGELCDGVPSGKGEFKSGSGEIYGGTFIAGQLEGEGTKTTPVNMVYTGPFRNGKMHGKFIAVTKNGARVFSYWRNGNQVSMSEVWESSQYNGEFDDIGQRHGKGSFTYDRGDVYMGQWLNDEAHGEGTYIWGTGGSYIGTSLNGINSGQGVLTLPSGYRYEGEFVEGLKHGQGKERLTNGDIYIGRFWKGARHGEGQCGNSNGSTKICRYDQGHLLPDDVSITPLSDDVGVASFTSKSKTSPDGVLPEGAGELLEFEFTDDCWIRVSDANDEVLVIGVKKRGQRIHIHGLAPLMILLGNPAGERLQQNERPLDLSVYPDGRFAKIIIDGKSGTVSN